MELAEAERIVATLGDDFPQTREERDAVRTLELAAEARGDAEEAHRWALKRLHFRAGQPQEPEHPIAQMTRLFGGCKDIGTMARELIEAERRKESRGT